jgi:hypothetical protein
MLESLTTVRPRCMIEMTLRCESGYDPQLPDIAMTTSTSPHNSRATSGGGISIAAAAVGGAVARVITVVVAPALLIFCCHSKDARQTGHSSEGERPAPR